MSGYDMDALADVYFSSRKTQHAYRQVLWRMTVADAQRFCEHPATCHPGSWMMCWTVHELVDARPICFVADDGRFDALFEELGVTVLMSKAMLLAGDAPPAPSKPKPVKSSPIHPAQLGLFDALEAA